MDSVLVARGSSVVFVALLLALAAVRGEDAFGEEYGGMEGGEYGGYGGGEYGGYGDMMGGMGGYGGDDMMGGMGGYGDYGGYGGEYGDPGPAFSTIDDAEGVQKFLDEEPTEPAVVGFFNEDTNQEDIDRFTELAGQMRYTVRFAYTIEDDVREAFKFKGGCSVVVYAPPRFVNEKYDKPKTRYPGKTIDAGALEKFITKKALPLVGQRSWKASEMYDAAGLPIVTLFVKVDLDKNPKGFDYYCNRLRRVAKDFVGRLLFNVGDKEEFSYKLDDFGLDLPGKNDVGVGVQDGNKHWAMEASFSVDNLRAFCEDLVAGKLEPTIKEEPAYDQGGYGEEEDADDGSPSTVVAVTDDNFADVVNDGSKDVLIEFYAPWCGHCQQLKPVYKKLAAEFDAVDSVTIAAMDATAGEIPAPFDVSGYPTIMFVPANAKDSPVPYDGPRDVNSMAAFVRENAAVPIAEAATAEPDL